MAFLKVNTFKTLSKLPTFLIKPLVNFGYQEDSPDLYYKDYKFSDSPMASTQILSEEISIKHLFKDVSNQYSIGSCVANACADALESQVALRKGVAPTEVPDLSRMFVYYNARNLARPTPTTNVDKGSQIRLAMDSVRRYGICKEQTCPYDSTYLYKQPGFLMYKEALQNKISAFYRIDSSDEDERFEQILKALNNNNPVVFGVMVQNSFRTAKDNVLPSPRNFDSDNVIGSHAMCITGWSKARNCYEIRNSWGNTFGVNGYCYMSKDYICGFAKDIWVATV